MPDPGADAKHYMNAEPESDFHAQDTWQREPMPSKEDFPPENATARQSQPAVSTAEYEPTARFDGEDLRREHRARFAGRDEPLSPRRRTPILATVGVLLAGTILTGLLLFRSNGAVPNAATNEVAPENRENVVHPVAVKTDSAAFALRPSDRFQSAAATKPLPSVVRHVAPSSATPTQTTLSEPDETVILPDTANKTPTASSPSRSAPSLASNDAPSKSARSISNDSAAVSVRHHRRHITKKSVPVSDTSATETNTPKTEIAEENTIAPAVPETDIPDLHPRRVRRHPRPVAPEVMDDDTQADVERDPYPANHRDAGDEGDFGGSRRRRRHSRPPGEDENADRWIDNLPR